MQNVPVIFIKLPAPLWVEGKYSVALTYQETFDKISVPRTLRKVGANAFERRWKLICHIPLDVGGVHCKDGVTKRMSRFSRLLLSRPNVQLLVCHSVFLIPYLKMRRVMSHRL